MNRLYVLWLAFLGVFSLAHNTELKAQCTACGITESYGNGEWNSYVYTGMDLNNLYAFIGNRTWNSLNYDWGTGRPSPVSPPGACGDVCTDNNFSTSHRMSRNFDRGFYYITYSSDDGIRISLDGGASWVVNSFNNSTQSGNLVVLLDGVHQMRVDHRENTGGAAVNVQICQMSGNYTFGTYGTWNAYAFNRTNLPNNNFSDVNSYAGWFTTNASGSTLIHDNWGANGHPRGGDGPNATPGSCSGAPSTGANNFSVRYLTRRTYNQTGIHVFKSQENYGSGAQNDDGRRLFIDYNNTGNTISSPTQIFDNYGSGAGITTSNPVDIQAGTHGLIYDFREGSGDARATLSECQMDAGGTSGSLGNATAYGASAWNVYLYNGNNYNFNTSDYQGTFTIGSSNTTSATFTLNPGNGNLNSSRVGQLCDRGGTGNDNYSVRVRLSRTFNKGIYSVCSGADDRSRMRVQNAGSSWTDWLNLHTDWVDGSAGRPYWCSEIVFNGGAVNIEYEGYESSGGAIFGANISCNNAVAGILSTNQSCGAGSHTLTWAGGSGFNILQYSTDGGNTWINSGTEEVKASTSGNRTWNVSPSSNEVRLYRVMSYSCSSTVYSNTILVVNSVVNYTGNLTINENVTLSGTLNISGDFTLNAGRTITLAEGCPLVVNADNIIIHGHINGEGKGFSGASGVSSGGQDWANASRNTGGGSGGASGNGSGAGQSGITGGNGNRKSRVDGSCITFACNGTREHGYGNGGGGGGGGGGGSYGGIGGAGGAGARGGWIEAPDWDCDINCAGNTGGTGGAFGSIYGTTEGTDIQPGSGGGSGGSGGGAHTAGLGGSAGGNGGGAISLIACNALTISSTSTINMNGIAGQNGGGKGGDENDNSNNLTPDAVNWRTCLTTNCVANWIISGGQGGGSGGGSGGGVLLQGFGPVNISSSAAITARGGNGGQGFGHPSTAAADEQGGKAWSIGGNPGRTLTLHGYYNAQNGAAGGGGRIKVFVNPCQNNNVSIAAHAVNGGASPAGSNNDAGNGGSAGTLRTELAHPEYTALNAGTISTSGYGVCYNTAPSTDIVVGVSTGGANKETLVCTANLPQYSYQWYVTRTACENPNTATSNLVNTGWEIISGSVSLNISAAEILNAINQVGNLATADKYCFQRRTKSANCYAWTDTVSVTVRPEVSDAMANYTLAQCADPATPYAFLNAEEPVVGTGFWSIVSGPGAITASSAAQTTITGLSSSGMPTEVSWTVGFTQAPACSKSQTITITPVVLQTGGVSSQSGNTPPYYTCTDCKLEDDKIYTYYDNTGRAIARIQDLSSVPPSAPGTTEVCIGYTYDTGNIPDTSDVRTVWTDLGDEQPYLPRFWTIKPENQTDALITLYFTEAELNALKIKATGTLYEFEDAAELKMTKYSSGGEGTFAAPTSEPGVQVPVTVTRYPSSEGSDYAVTFSINSFSTFYLHPNQFDNAILPVELVSFTAYHERAQNRNTLVWTTASEKNADRFEIEKSADGKKWDYAGEQSASGNSTQPVSYSFHDYSPWSGDNYYRLKMIDEDGTFEYSRMISVSVKQETTQGFVAIYPNPVEDVLTVVIQAETASKSHLNISGASGQIVKTTPVTLQKGENVFKLNVRTLTSGAYIISYTDHNGIRYTERIVRQ